MGVFHYSIPGGFGVYKGKCAERKPDVRRVVAESVLYTNAQRVSSIIGILCECIPKYVCVCERACDLYVCECLLQLNS